MQRKNGWIDDSMAFWEKHINQETGGRHEQFYF